ncbi:MAG TPA: O-methyltransferase [Candidatus Acidoferrales bacterium]|nr:O-methyltransferase [Candidatus Acidoferrales bacterium]
MLERAQHVDDYLASLFVGDDADLERALEASRAAGLPPIAVSAVQGKLLHLLARMQRARRILEIGTLAGYSAIWLARALPPGGTLISLEINPKHAAVARANLAAAGLDAVASVEVGPALKTLDRMIASGAEPFDLVFIDADKENNSNYIRRALELSRPGTLVAVDNVVRGGAIIDPANTDPMVTGTKRGLELLANEPRLSATVLQTLGDKGYDGLALAIVD